MGELRRILIADDSEIDREVLKSILAGEFLVEETENGYKALELILNRKDYWDAVLLDISMPVLDGISVLRMMRENDVNDLDVFMITAEATKDNVAKALNYNIASFIKKPFDRKDVLQRIRSKLGTTVKMGIANNEIEKTGTVRNGIEETGAAKDEREETRRYISDLEHIYNRYLSLTGQGKETDERRAYFMRLLLKRYSATGKKLDAFQIEMLSKAAYLCNIGDMLIYGMSSGMESKSGKADSDLQRQHTVLGADMIQLNYSEYCKSFVKLCADICRNHHERYDGGGFPHGIRGAEFSVYAQICGLLERFDELYFPYSRHNELQFEYVIEQLKRDEGFVSKEVFLLLEDCKSDIIKYYSENDN